MNGTNYSCLFPWRNSP